MPKESIYNADNSSRITLQWARDMYAQIGVEHDKDGSWDGLFHDLDRHQINELIRTLCRVRNQAYGKDE